MSSEKGNYRTAKLFPDINMKISDSNITETISEFTKTIDRLKENFSYDLFGRLVKIQKSFKPPQTSILKNNKNNYFSQNLYLTKNRVKLAEQFLNESRIDDVSTKKITSQNSRVKTATQQSPMSIARQQTLNSAKSLQSNTSLTNFKNNYTTQMTVTSRNVQNVDLLPTEATEEYVSFIRETERKLPFRSIFKPHMSNRELLNTISGEYFSSERIKKTFSKKLIKLDSSVKGIRKQFYDEFNKERNDMIKLMQEDYLFFEKDSLSKKTRLHFHNYTFNAISKIKENTAFQANSLLRTRVGLCNEYKPKDFKLNITKTKDNQHTIKYMIKRINIKKEKMLVKKSPSSSIVRGSPLK
jgi:hypothetical protein